MVKKIKLSDQKVIDESNRVPEPEVVVEELPVKKVRQKRAKKVKPVVEEKADDKPVVEEKTDDKPVKKKRAPSAYNIFVKETIPKLTHIPPKERFSEVSKLWKKQKEKK